MMGTAYPDGEEIFKYVYATVMDNLTRFTAKESDTIKKLIATNVALTLRKRMTTRKRKQKRSPSKR